VGRRRIAPSVTQVEVETERLSRDAAARWLNHGEKADSKKRLGRVQRRYFRWLNHRDGLDRPPSAVRRIDPATGKVVEVIR
jgi:hypothetical protein